MQDAKNYKKIFKIFLIFFLGLVMGFLLFSGYFFDRHILFGRISEAGKGNFLLRESGKYKFISPLLICGVSENKEFSGFGSLKKKITTLINKKLDANEAAGISVYIRKFNSGRWVGVNEDDKYSPASLLKVARAVAYFKFAESNPEILSRSVTDAGNFDDNKAEYFKSSHFVTPGRSYTIEELIKFMIQNSDNNATRLLDENISSNSLNTVYRDLGIPTPDFYKDNGDFLSSKFYSYFFRILYNSTYISRESSEKLLDMLSGSDFSEGIRKTVPDNIVVSHKFGERSNYRESGVLESRELHDCGIVYYPKDPYFICVMTKGSDFDDLKEIIQDISGLVFDEISSVGS